ncbi:hypothetical protein HanHA300_Chr17g0661181 [Helianthus annuus]|nr:hypothetical protein HanHA300_Chr17g0661181 [Helianthus annuus]
MSGHITFYAERNASAQVYMKLKLYVSGRRRTSHTTFEARPWGNTNRHGNNDANPVSRRTTTKMQYFAT